MQDVEATHAEATHAETLTFRSGRLLLASAGDSGALGMAASILRRRGHQVEIGDASEAIAALHDPYDLVMFELDARNPTTLSFVARLREVSHVPLLVLTPMTGRSQGIRALELGADGFVVLPFDRRELIARCEALIRRYRQTFPFVARGYQQGVTARSPAGSREIGGA